MTDPSIHTFDVVVLGGGSGGYATALRAAQLGLRVALIERDRLGGTCLHAGCIPTKALLHAAEVADQTRASGAVGIRSTFEGVDMAALHTFKDGVVTRLHHGLQGLIAGEPGITVVRGTGRLLDPRTVEVDGTHYRGTSVVLATGSIPRALPGVEIGGRVLSSTEALALETVPSSVVIIGGSAIGVEFASAWRSLGADITILEAQDALVPAEDPALAKHLQRALRRRKIALRTGVGVARVTQDHDHATVTLDDGDLVEAAYVLVAVGRVPATSGLGLDELGVETARGCVVTDERLVTTVENVYAVGDLVAGPQLAHRGFAHGIFVAEEIAGLKPQPVQDTLIPRVTYSHPEIASVGMTEPQAREAYGDVSTFEYNLAGNGRSQILQTTGIVKVVRRPDGPIVGVHMVGDRMGEQVGEAALLVNLGVSPEEAARVVHAHPTQNEALGEAFLALSGTPLHTHA